MLIRLLLICFLLPLGASTARSHDAPKVLSAQDDGLEEASKVFRRQMKRRGLEIHQEALVGFLEVVGVEGIPTILQEFIKARRLRVEATRELQRLDLNLRARKRVVADLELRSKRDESLEKIARQHRSRLKYEEIDLKVLRKDDVAATEWALSLAAAIETQFAALHPSKLKRYEKELWKDLDKAPDVNIRLAAAELLGLAGKAGTTIKLQKAVATAESVRSKALKKLPKAEKKVREFEVLLQRDSAANGGRVNRSMSEQYEGIRSEAAALRRQVDGAGRLAEACAEAAVKSLNRETGVPRNKTLAELEKALARSTGVVRRHTQRILAAAGGEPIRNKLRLSLRVEKDPAVMASLIDDLCGMQDMSMEPVLIEEYLQHENWHVAARAIAGLTALRSKDSIAVMIIMLESAEGRTITDLRRALRSLTGKRFRTAVLWQRWWDDEGGGFEVPTKEVTLTAEEAEREQIGTTRFFGVETDSTSVVFVLDLSGSMNFSMVARSGLSDASPDMPRRGELSRLQVAKTELKKAVAGLSDGTRFNLVLYASSAWTWKKGLVEMDPDSRDDALEFIDGLKAVGGTNIYGAMMEALALAGADASGEWSEPEVDTIYLLSDGIPSMGVTTDSDIILSTVAENNKGAGIVIHTIGLSGAQDAYLLRNLAEANGGIYTAR
ncbi:MAG: hypothetical protein ACI8QC_000600 [Planctomycetota bacterium]|jgi:hypothetical protein